jgi:hypothetical protein
LLSEHPVAQPFFPREQADRCRRLARSTSDAVTQERLVKLAAEYEAQADAQDDADAQAPAPRFGKGGEDEDG